MATRAFEARCTSLRLAMSELTAAMTVISTISIYDPMLCVRIKQLEAPRERMYDSKINLTPDLMGTPSQEHQHMLFMVDYTNLLDVLTPQLRRVFTAKADGVLQPRTIPFENLWTLLFVCSVTFMQWPGSWPVSQHQVSARLGVALNNMLLLLLHMTRQPIWPSLLSATPSGLIFELSRFLVGPVWYAKQLSHAHPSTFLAQLHALPSGMLSTLCCIISDQMRGKTFPLQGGERLPPSTATPTHLICTAYPEWEAYLLDRPAYMRDFFEPLAELLNTLVDAHYAGGHTSPLGPLTTPAIVHVSKLIVLASLSKMCAHTLFDRMVTLGCLLGQLSKSAGTQRDISITIAASGQSPAATHSLLPTPAHKWAADKRLVQAVCRSVSDEPRLISTGYALLSALIENWQFTPVVSVDIATAAEMRSGMKSCYRMIELHCLRHSLRWLQNCRRQDEGTALPRKQLVAQQMQQKTAPADAQLPPAAAQYLFSFSAMLEATAIMALLSSFGSTFPNAQGVTSRIMGAFLVPPRVWLLIDCNP